MPVKRCLNCNEDFAAKSKFCSECGGPLGISWFRFHFTKFY